MRDLVLHKLALVVLVCGSLAACGGKQKSANGTASDAPAAASGTDTAGVDTDKSEGRGEGTQCGESFEKDSDKWFPGLPYAPLDQPIVTGGRGDLENTSYTDSHRDALMAYLVDHSNALPAETKRKSRELAMRIFGLNIDLNGREALVGIDLLAEVQGQANVGIQLGGQADPGGRRTLLKQVKNGKSVAKPDYAGALICADQGGGCKTAIVELHRVNSKGEKTRMVFMVSRQGDAHITMSEQTRHDYPNLENKEARRFSEYLANTAHNSCMSILDAADQGRRELPACAIQRLTDECGASNEVRRPYAQKFILRTWSVAYGRSAFDLTLTSGSQDLVTVRGPLLIKKDGGTIGQPLEISGRSKYYANPAQVTLLNNDGGGALNLNIQFKGEPEAETRINITSRLADTRYVPAE